MTVAVLSMTAGPQLAPLLVPLLHDYDHGHVHGYVYESVGVRHLQNPKQHPQVSENFADAAQPYVAANCEYSPCEPPSVGIKYIF